MAESPVTRGVIWAGTDDGLVQITRNAGRTWTNITPPLLKEREWARISSIEASRYDVGTAYVAANRFQMDDQEPYLFKTTDYGATWSRIDGSGQPNGIPATEFTRVLREDEERRGLLFAGTERGVYASLDAGATWFSLRRNLPIVPVHDLAVKEGDLVVGTHGRSFYVLDDLSVLRQLTAPVLRQRAHLFTPRPTYRITWSGDGFRRRRWTRGQNPPSGVIVNFWLKEAAKRVTLEFRDSTGRTIRSFGSDTTLSATAGAGNAMQQEAPPRRGGGADPMVPNRTGLNSFSWNLRESDATRFDGMIFWGAGTTGPLIPPGTYAVRLMVDGAQAGEAKFLVKKDPRSDATPADLVAQYKLLMQIRDRTTDANDAVRTVRSVRNQVAARASSVGADSAQYAVLMKALDLRISELEAKIYQVKNQSGQDPLNYPIKVNNQIAALAGVVGSTEARPTKQSYVVFDTLTKELEVYLVDLRRAWKDMLPPIDEILRKHGHPAIEVETWR